MKKLILLVTFLLVSSTCAFATPVYTGDTYAAWGEGGLPTLPTSTGYYIWSNDVAKTSWSVRWTGNNDGATADWESWNGTVEFVGNDMTSLTAIEWDSLSQDGVIPQYYNFAPVADVEFISYSSQAGWHWDGFDFTINENADAGRLRFNLGGSYYSDLDLTDTDAGVAAYAMWIGDGNIMDVDIATTTQLDPNYQFQSFETPAPVPEPGTLLLLGSGLIGLAFLKRRKQ